MNDEIITIPSNRYVNAVHVQPDPDGEFAVPGHVLIKADGELARIYVDGQALANALAELGYRAAGDTADRERLSRRVDHLAGLIDDHNARLIDMSQRLSVAVNSRERLARRVELLTDRMAELENRPSETPRREPHPGDRYRDKDGDIWVVRDGATEMQCDLGGIVRSVYHVRDVYGPLTPLNGAPEL
jgi:hypothetical protein